MSKETVKDWMRINMNNHIDPCNEVNCTSLAEEAADVFDLYEDHEDYVIPEEVFDWAVEVADGR